MIRKFYDGEIVPAKGGWEDKKVGEERTGALRFNDGKTRFDLLEPYAIEQLAKVFTKGAEKYPANNWLKGLSWTGMLASLKRHLNEFEQGHDYDKETELLHIAHVAWNAMALLSYHKHFPQGDDRYVNTKSLKKIGLDIDQVVAEWAKPWCEKYGFCTPTSFNFHRGIKEIFDEQYKSGELQEFYSKLEPLVDFATLPFEPVVFISHRPVDVDISEKWLDMIGAPTRPVIHVKTREEKVAVAKQYKLDIFVDDNYDTFRDMNAGGVACYLLDAPHNRKFDVGYRRIKNLSELPL